MKISPMTYLEYHFFFRQENSALADRCVKEADSFHLLFSARMDGKYAGYICAVADNPLVRITYAYTLPEHRRKGVFTGLVQFIAEHSVCDVRVPILTGHEYYTPMVSALQKLGFVPGESVQVFTCERKNYPGWQQFMDQKGRSMCAYLRRRGYASVSFADADADIIRQLRESPKTDYQNTLSPAEFLDHPEKMLSMDMSFAAVKDGRLAAYTLVSRNSKTKIIFEHISDSAKERGTGAILLPFACAMEKFDEYGCTIASYAMYGSNTHANAFRDKLLKPLNTSVTCVENYFYHRQKGKA